MFKGKTNKKHVFICVLIPNAQYSLCNYTSQSMYLRIDTGDLRPICQNSCVSPTNARILIYCTSNERQYLYLSVDVFNS